MSGMFHVFVEGAADPTPVGIKKLADAIALKYGLPAPDLHARLQAGRFRVKGNVDRATADIYAKDLERLGARCTVEDARQPPSASSVADPLTLRTPAGGLPVVAQPPSRPSAPPSALAGMPRAPTPPPAPGAFASGLAAAFNVDAGPAAGLGALESDGAPLSLATVDGDDTSQPHVIEKSPEPQAKSKTPAKAKPKDEPLDMFAPPDAQGEQFKVDIADDEKDFARKRAGTPAPVVAATERPATQPPSRAASQPAAQPSGSFRPASQPAGASARVASQPAATVLRSKLGPLADERVRTIAGVVLAILIGFIPAHFVARSREASAYHELDARLISLQSNADTPEAYAALDRTRADFLERKHEERRNIALMALAIWALVGGAIGYGWFKRVPWDEL